MVKAELPAIEKDPSHYNLAGQRLGRKGRVTRERILAATERLLVASPGTAISLSAVAREASLAMTTLYLYFSDLTELLLAVLDPIVASAEESHLSKLRGRWPDGELGERCLDFLEAYYRYWSRHSRILHLRNSFADSNDVRMRQHRIEAAMPLINLLVLQMDGDPAIGDSRTTAMATVLITGIERTITMQTDAGILQMQAGDSDAHTRQCLEEWSKLLEFGIREGRAASKHHAELV